MTERQVLGLIPARGGSKGVPRKNIRPLSERPLIGYTIQAAKNAETISSVVVSTEDEEIAEIAASEGAEVPFRRPNKLATDETPTEPVVEHATKALEKQGRMYDDIVLLQPTSPLRTASHIDEAYQLYDSTNCDSVVSVSPTHEIRWQRGPDGAQRVDDSKEGARRQDREPEYVSNGAVYITSVNDFKRTNSLTPGFTELYEMDEVTSVDIDTPFDFWLAERIMEEWHDDKA